MNWCKTCKKELPMEPCCNVGPECSSCRADRLERELEQAQAKLLASEAGKKQPKHSYSSVMELMLATGVSHEVIEKFDALRDQEIEDLQVMLHNITEQRDKAEAAGAEMREKYQDLRYFVRAVCLLLQRHRGATKQEMDRMFQISYRLYTKHDVEHPLSIPCGTAFLDERERHVKALEEIAGYGKDGICPYGCDCPNIARTALNRNEP